jgi:cellulose synthase/poly-beta-1,6-N-acetylglucosamine synthase-like glycosyltransferase
MKLSVVVPIKVNQICKIADLKEYLSYMCENIFDDQEIIIIDDSSEDVSTVLKSWFNCDQVKYFFLPEKYKTGLNGKLNALEYALNIAEGEYIFYMDDDCRPSIRLFNDLYKYFDVHECFRCMSAYERPNFADLINLCGLFVINCIDPRKQFWGHIIINRNTLISLGIPDKDILFDDFAVDFKFRQSGKNIGYVKNIAVNMISNTTVKAFFQQRVRYAYENMVYPSRFIFFLSIIPLLVMISFLFGIFYTLLLIVVFTILTWTVAATGQIIYGAGRVPIFTFLAAPIWFWFYPITSWFALFYFFYGGIKFGGKQIRKVI